MDMTISDLRVSIKDSPAPRSGAESIQNDAERIIDELRRNLITSDGEEMINALRASLIESSVFCR